MGAVQKLATVVIVGLVALATVLVLYLADEDNRIKAEEKAQQDDAIERAMANYISLCLSCHGPAGEGFLGPGEMGTGRIGAPLGGNTFATLQNQQGIKADGSPVPGGVNARATVISQTIHNGREAVGMPAWGEENGGPLNASQIEELVTMIQHVDWNEVYNKAVETSGGYPTAAPNDPRKTPTPTTGAVTPTAPATSTSTAGVTIDLVDIAFAPKELTIPANTAVTLTLVNKGATVHTFDIDALGIKSGDIAPGASTTVSINAAPGDYEYYCAIPGHKDGGMVGTLHVVEGAAPPPAQEQAPPPAAQAQAPTVQMHDIFFDPKELTIPANTAVTLNLVNTGATVHTFDIDALGIKSGEYAPGQTGTVTINAAPGEYEYYCAIPGHKDGGMVGKLIVQ